MALTSYGVNNALAVKLWSKKLFVEALKQTWSYRFMGRDDSSVIQLLDDTEKSAGDKVTIGLRMQLTGAGVQGDGTLEGNEEALATYSDAVYIDQLRHAVRSAGKMSEQRIPFEVREQARMGLQDWWADRIDTWFFNQVGGYTVQTDTRYTGNQATVAPDSSHAKWVTGSADESQTSTNTFTLAMIDKCVEAAQTLSPMIRPIMIQGEAKYVMFLHPYQVTDLRAASSSLGNWYDIQKAAIQGGEISKNPIYTGAIGEYNGCILHQSYRVPQGVNSSSGAAITTVRRAVFCGAQSAVLAYGQENGDQVTWIEELFDYNNQLGVSAGMIAGMKKVRFNSADFGTITASTYAAAH